MRWVPPALVVVLVLWGAWVPVAALEAMSPEMLLTVRGSWGDREACSKNNLSCASLVCGISGCEITICQHNPTTQRCEQRVCTGEMFDTCVSCAPECETRCNHRDPLTYSPCMLLKVTEWDPLGNTCVGDCEVLASAPCAQEDCENGPIPEPPPPPPPPPGGGG
jgi:hypothetical protein